MNIEFKIKELIRDALLKVYNLDYSQEKILLGATKKEFEGDYTFTSFPVAKDLKKSPQEVSVSLGNFILNNSEMFSDLTSSVTISVLFSDTSFVFSAVSELFSSPTVSCSS